MTAQRPPTSCGFPGRFWILPVAVFAIFVAVGIALLVLGQFGVVPAPRAWGPSPGYWWLVPLGFLTFWVVVILAVRPWHWQGGWGWGYDWSSASDAVEVVRVRFARGEISRDTMTNLLRDLNEAANSTGDDRIR